MAKLHRKTAGSYYFEREIKGAEPETVNIFQIETGLWGWCIGKGMTQGTFSSLREAKAKLLPLD